MKSLLFVGFLFCFYICLCQFVLTQKISIEILQPSPQLSQVSVEASSKFPNGIQLRIRDSKGEPLNNQSVYFFATPNSNSRLKPYFSSKVVNTQPDGSAKVDVTAGYIPGEGSISISTVSPDGIRYLNSEDYALKTITYKVTRTVYGEAWGQISVVFAISILSIIGAVFVAIHIMRKDRGTEAMQNVADPIAQGAKGFMKTQYLAISAITIPVALILFGLYMLRSKSANDPDIHIAVIATVVTVSFLLGVVFSGLSGFISMFVSVSANSRVTMAATRSYREALNIALRSGAFAGFLVVSLSVLGVIFLFTILYLAIPQEIISPTQIVGMIVGFSFGCSLSALFAQLGGGIFTKAADVGADLVGKVEQDIPEDDLRNPAVIADLVGDNVGDCSGRGADIFESLSAENIGVMILGGTLTASAYPQISTPISYIIFPLIVHICGMIGTWVGIFFVRVRDVSELHVDDSYSLISNNEAINAHEENSPVLHDEENNDDDAEIGVIKQEALDDPMTALNIGYIVSVVVTTCLFVLISWWLLRSEQFPDAWWKFTFCGIIGIFTSLAFVAITVYYTDFNWRPVKEIVEASKTGPATNVISGISVGLESTGLPVLIITIAIIGSYYLGNSSGIVNENGKPIGGLFGIAVATIGMLSSSSYILAMDVFGPIVDNSGGIAEMSQLSPNVRVITDKLDAVGNTTKALTKGYAVGSAALAAFLLFSAYLDTVTAYTGIEFSVVNLASPEVFVGGLLGACLVFIFSSFTIRAVGNTAQTVIEEVRRQFREIPGIMEFKQKPDYEKCVAIVTRSALIQMIFPGALAVILPILVGFFFRMIGYYSNQPYLGAEVSAGFLMVATIACILMALFFNNSGGAWDNAKKFTEMDKRFGGKGSAIHKSAVIGDTIGDPFKDTAGPSIHVLCKLLATLSLLFAVFFINF
ncbi:hypothetical protein ABK040_007115 [Willaertia magna]